MKKIVMIGALWTRNFGDVLLADLFGEKVKENGGEPFFPTVSDGVAKDLGVRESVLRSFIGADAYLFFGGGYLSEPPSGVIKWALSRYLRIFVFADICRLLGKKYYVIGVGAGPCTSKLTKLIFKRFCNNAQQVVVRDLESYETLKRIGVKNDVQVACDLALSVAMNTTEVKLLPGMENRTLVALHLTSRQPDLNEKIISYFMNSRIRENVWFIEDHPGEFERVYSVNPSVKRLVGERVVHYINHKDFVDKIGLFDFVITSKLHVGIIASALNKRICSFPYHGKVIAFYKSIDRPDICYVGDRNSEEDIKLHLEKCMRSEPVTLTNDIERRLLFLDGAIKNIVRGVSND